MWQAGKTIGSSSSPPLTEETTFTMCQWDFLMRLENKTNKNKLLCISTNQTFIDIHSELNLENKYLLGPQEINDQQSKTLTMYLKSFISNKATVKPTVILPN